MTSSVDNSNPLNMNAIKLQSFAANAVAVAQDQGNSDVLGKAQKVLDCANVILNKLGIPVPSDQAPTQPSSTLQALALNVDMYAGIVSEMANNSPAQQAAMDAVTSSSALKGSAYVAFMPTAAPSQSMQQPDSQPTQMPTGQPSPQPQNQQGHRQQY